MASTRSTLPASDSFDARGFYELVAWLPFLLGQGVFGIDTL